MGLWLPSLSSIKMRYLNIGCVVILSCFGGLLCYVSLRWVAFNSPLLWTEDGSLTAAACKLVRKPVGEMASTESRRLESTPETLVNSTERQRLESTLETLTSDFSGYTTTQMLRGSFGTTTHSRRLKAFLKLLASRTRPVRVLASGGSITDGNTNCCGRVGVAQRWPGVFEAWMNTAFPVKGGGKHVVENKARGARSIVHIGRNPEAALLMDAPYDLVVLEFACNDMLGVQGRNREDLVLTTELAVRNIFHRVSKDCALVFLEIFPGAPEMDPYMNRNKSQDVWHGYLTGQYHHQQVLSYYTIPAASLRDALFPEMHIWRNKTLGQHEWNLENWLAGHDPFSRSRKLRYDSFHPNAWGHARIGRFLAHFMLTWMCARDILPFIPTEGENLPTLFVPKDKMHRLLRPPTTRLDFDELPHKDALITRLENLASPLEHNSTDNPGINTLSTCL